MCARKLRLFAPRKRKGQRPPSCLRTFVEELWRTGDPRDSFESAKLTTGEFNEP